MKLKSYLGIASALGMVHAAPGMAQTATSQRAAPTDPSTADIIVTARRTEERLQDVPISITVFNQEQISNRNIVNASDLATYTPSLSSNTNFGTEYTSFAIRGFVQDPATAPSVGVYFAEVVAPRGPTQGTQAGDGAGPGTLFDLQNVQVLKGPQGTLFGRNTTGGAVLFVPQKPTSELGGYVEGSYGNYDMKRVQGAINIPLSDIARFRLSGDYMNRDGYLKNNTGIGPKDFADVNYYSIRASLVVDLTPDLENYTIVSYTNSDTNGASKKTFACSNTGFGPVLCAAALAVRHPGQGFYEFQNNVPNPTSQIESWQVINTTTYKASDSLTVKNIASYGQLTALQRSPLFGTDFQLGGRGIYFATINPAPGRKSVDQSTFSEELQLQGSSSDLKLTWQAGAYLEISDPLSTIGNQSPFGLNCTNPDTFQCLDLVNNAFTGGGRGPRVFPAAVNLTLGQTSFRDVGLYTQASYALTEQLKVTGGFRYTWDRTTNDSIRASYIFPYATAQLGGPPTPSCTDDLTQIFTGQNCGAHTEQKSNKPTWLIDVDYKPSEDILLYAKYARGYRAGGLATNSPANYRTFEPEKVDSYEAGIKTSLRGPVRGTFNVAGFYNDFSNQQIQAGFTALPGRPVSSTAGPVNAGKSRIYGAEVEASISPFTGFRIDGSYTYLNAKIRSVSPIVTTDPNYFADFQIQAGNPLPLSPKNKVSVTGSYTLPLSEDIGRITFGATFTHVDKQLTTYLYINNPTIRAAFGGNNYSFVPAYDLVNLNLDWKGVAGSPIDLAVFVTNLTKKHYFTYIAGLGSAGFESGVLGEPRMFGGRARFRF